MSTSNETGTVRIRVIYTGHVQGVCFRITTVDISGGRSVTGFVRNIPDGTVELEAEGERREVEEFLVAIERHFAANLRDVQRVSLKPRGDESTFEITY